MFKVSSDELILASGSPRRRELLAACGLKFRVVSSDIPEEILPGEAPNNAVHRLSRLKGEAVAALEPRAWIISADTVVAIDGRILGKPRDTVEAESMLSSLQGRKHEVWTAFSVIHLGKRVEETEALKSEVEMEPLTSKEIQSYVRSGEPMDKAGAYAMQGLGAFFVRGMTGSYTNVVGLNISRVIQVLKAHKAIEVA